MAVKAGTQAAGIVQFLFDLQIDAKTSRAQVKTLVESLKDAEKSVDSASNRFLEGFSNISKVLKTSENKVTSIENSFSFLNRTVSLLIKSLPWLAALKLDNMMTKMAESVDVTAGKFGVLEGVVRTLRTNMKGFSSEEALEATIAVNKWGTLTREAMLTAAEGVLDLHRYTGLGMDSAAEMYRRYTKIIPVFKSMKDATSSLGASMISAALKYNLSGTEVVSALSMMEISILRVSAAQRANAVVNAVDTIASMKAMGVSANQTAGVIRNLSDITRESGNRLKAALMSFSGIPSELLMKYFSNPGNYTKEIMKAVQTMMKHPQIRYMAENAMDALTAMIGLPEEMIAPLLDPTKAAAIEKAASDAEKRAAQKEFADKQRDTRIGTMTTALTNMTNVLEDLAAELGKGTLRNAAVVLNKLTGLLFKLYPFIKWFSEHIVPIAGAILAVAVVAGLIVFFASGGWIPPLAVMIASGFLVVLKSIAGWLVTLVFLPAIIKVLADNWNRITGFFQGIKDFFGKNFGANIMSSIKAGLKFAIDISPIGRVIESFGILWDLMQRFIGWVKDSWLGKKLFGAGAKEPEFKVTTTGKIRTPVTPTTAPLATPTTTTAEGRVVVTEEDKERESRIAPYLKTTVKGQYKEVVDAIVHMERYLGDILRSNKNSLAYVGSGLGD